MKQQSIFGLALSALMLFICPSVNAQFLPVGSKLIGSGAYPVGSVQHGKSVALSGDAHTAVVGANGDSSTGAAWIFVRSGGAWNQQGSKIVGAGSAGFPSEGTSVGISHDGNTIIVGGPSDSLGTGAAWVFTRSGGTWSQQGGKLVGTGAAGAAQQGTSVALSADGNTAIIGGPFDNSFVGAAWVFTRSGGSWTQQGTKLVGTGAPSFYLGSNVALSADGNTAIVGAYESGLGDGAAWVFIRSGGVWTQQGGKLAGTGGVPAVTGIASSVSLSADGNTAALGASNDNSYAGGTWVFARSAGIWSQQGGMLTGTGGSGTTYQGYSVSLSGDGNTLIVGGTGDSAGTGAAWAFTRNGGVWTQLGNKLVGGNGLAAEQGYSVCVSADGGTAIVGGPSDDNFKGAAWIYQQYVTFSVHDRWNLVSLPVIVDDSAKSTIFPTATTNAYGYNNGYVSTAQLGNGYGYWLKFPSAQQITLDGLQRHRDTLLVAAGWNLIGSLSRPVAVADISSIPGGLVTSSFYSYDGGYTASTTIAPGEGYWVKVSSAGKLLLASGGSMSPTSRIRVQDTGEMPPAPPFGEPATSLATPEEYLLHQNYPNPFNPATMIEYALPTPGYVTLRVYNMLGQEVATLVNAVQDAGVKSIPFDASRLPSGVYAYQLTAGTFTEVRKMVLLR